MLVVLGKLDRFAYDLIQCEMQKEQYQELSRQAITAGATDLEALSYEDFVARASAATNRHDPRAFAPAVVHAVAVTPISGRDHHRALEAASEQLRNLKAVVDQIYLAIVALLHQVYGVPLT